MSVPLGYSLMIRSFSSRIFLHRSFCKNKTFSLIKPNFSSNLIRQRNFVFYICNYRGYAKETKQNGFGSRYHPLSSDEALNLQMHEVFKDKKKFSFDDWEEFRINFSDRNFDITDTNFDSVTMKALLSYNDINLAHSFMNYLKQCAIKPNLVTCTKYMLLCRQNIKTCSQDIILKIFNQIKSNLDARPVLDAVTVDAVVQGLCVTDEWKKSFSYLKKLPSNNPHHSTKDALACAAFDNDDESLGWSIITAQYMPGLPPSSYVLVAYAKLASRTYITNPKRGDSFMEKLIHYLQSKCIVVDKTLAEHITEFFKRHKVPWIIKNTNISDRGICNGCQTMLKPLMVSATEFQELKNAFFEKSLHKHDVYINSTQEEMRKFMMFINPRLPFDVVVDGLNVAHIAVETRSSNQMAKRLLEIVKCLSKSSKRILIIGKQHMRHWKKDIMEQIKNRALLFCTNNISQDDPFLIHAALASGPKALILSSDLMRDHKARLDNPALIQLFTRWQQSHQIYMIEGDNTYKFQGPLKYGICIQGSMQEGWHIPYDDSFILEPYEFINNWLCIQKP